MVKSESDRKRGVIALCEEFGTVLVMLRACLLGCGAEKDRVSQVLARWETLLAEVRFDFSEREL